MAFPAIVGSPVVTSGATATTTPTVNLPPGAVGHGLLMLIRVAVVGTIAFPGWTSLANDASDTSDDQTALFSRTADGTEGATVTGSSGNGRFAAIVWEVSGHLPFSTQPPELSTVAVGTGLAPNPTAVTPTGGAKDYLFGVLVGIEGEQGFTAGYPAAHTLGRQQTNSGAAGTDATNVRIAGAWRQANATFDDPGAITFTGTSDSWTAYAVAIHPAPTVTPIAGSDSLSLQGAETIALLAGAVATDTGSLSVTAGESASASAVGGLPTVRTRLTPMGIPGRRRTLAEVVIEPIAASDTLSLSLSEASTSGVSSSTSDTAQLSLSAEVGAPGVSSPVGDSLSLSVSEATSSALSSTRPDTLSLQANDVSAAPEPLVSSDSLSLSVSDTATVTSLNDRPVTRLTVLGIPGRRVVFAASPTTVSDDAAVSVTDAVSVLQVFIVVADTLTAALSETTTSALTSAVSDSPTLSLTDAITDQSLASTTSDLAAMSLDEIASPALRSDVIETASLQSSESALAAVSVQVFDQLTLDLPDESTLADVTFVGAEAADQVSLSLGEAVSLLVQSTPTDQWSLSVSETTSSALQSAVSATASLQVTEAVALANTSSVADSASLQVSDQATLVKSSAVADQASVQLTDAAVLGSILSEASGITLLEVSDVILALLSLVDRDDTASLSLTESASVVMRVDQEVSDSLTLDADEVSATATAGTFAIPADDDAMLGITDTADALLSSDRLETLSLQLVEIATRLVSEVVVASDTLTLGVTESAVVVSEIVPSTTPLLIFEAPTRPAALVSSMDVLTYSAPERPSALASALRPALFASPERPAALIATLDDLVWFAPDRPAAVTSPFRALTYEGPERHAALIAALNLFTFAAPERPTALLAGARLVDYDAPERPAAVVAAADLLLYEAPERHAALVGVSPDDED